MYLIWYFYQGLVSAGAAYPLDDLQPALPDSCVSWSSRSACQRSRLCESLFSSLVFLDPSGLFSLDRRRSCDNHDSLQQVGFRAIIALVDDRTYYNQTTS